jgi:hypothetical protein
MGKQKDWISLIEASYRLEGSDQEWLENLLDHASPLLDRGLPPLAWTFRYTPTTFELGHMTRQSPEELVEFVRLGVALASPAAIDLTYRSGYVIGTASDLIFPRLPDQRALFLSGTGGRRTF